MAKPERLKSPGKILIIDDDVYNAGFLDDCLTGKGYEVVHATSGEKGLAVLRRQDPDVILLDVMMPGMDGFQVCQQIRSDPETTHIPVLMVTALNETKERIKALEVGADDFLSKPINKLELITRVRTMFKLKNLADKLERTLAYLSEIESQIHIKNSD